MAILTGDIKLDIVGLLISVAAVIYVYFKWSFQYWKRRNFPYLPGTIPIGSIVSPYKKRLGDQYAEMYNYAKQKGWRYFGIYNFSKPNLIVVDLELLKNILTKDFNNFMDRGFFSNEENENITGNLFAIGGTKWKYIRMKLTPTFTSVKIKAMFQIIQDYCVLLEKQTEKFASKKEAVDIKELLGCFTVDVIGSCAFGLDCNSFKDPDNRFLRIGQTVVSLDFLTLMKQNFAISFPEIAKFLKLRFFPKITQEFYSDVVRKTIAYREQNNVVRNDFLQMLIDIKNTKNGEGDEEKTFTMDEVIAQCFVFFIGGFETSSTTMAFAMYELAKHPEFQDKLRAEIKQVLRKYNNSLTFDALKELEYMDQVIDETLRKHSPLSFVTRKCTEDYKIPNSNNIIEKDTVIVISIKGIHYDKDIYENPEEFNPERFTPENKKNRHPYAQLAFGEGPRICIGKRFGLTQTKVGLATVLKNHKVTLNKKTRQPLQYDTKSQLISVAMDGIWLNIEKI